MAGVGHTHRVVVIESDHDRRAAMMGVLTAQGWDVAGAADGEEALVTLKTSPRPCIIFLDFMMPGMDGWAIMNELGAHPAFAWIPIVVMTAYGTPEGARALGATDCLMRPFALSRLVDAVLRLCPFAKTV